MDETRGTVEGFQAAVGVQPSLANYRIFRRPPQTLVQRNTADHGTLRKQSDQEQSPDPTVSRRKSILSEGERGSRQQYPSMTAVDRSSLSTRQATLFSIRLTSHVICEKGHR